VAGHEGEEPTARRLLGSPDSRVRATALGALVRMGRAVAADVAAALSDDDPAVRRRAVALAVPFAGVPLVPLLDDADAAVVEQAAWACGERVPGEPGAVERLAALATGHDDPLVREAAVAALGALGDEAGLPAILAATGDRPAVRRRAVLALAPFSGPEVDAALDRALEDRDWQVRQAAEDLRDA
jgi:HEAT repeat protein